MSKNNIFTRKDYTREAIKAGYKLKAIDDIIDSFLELFREYNPDFNEDTFDYRYIPLLKVQQEKGYGKHLTQEDLERLKRKVEANPEQTEPVIVS